MNIYIYVCVYIYGSSSATPKLLALSISDLVHSSGFYFQDIFKTRWDLANSIRSF